MRNKTLIPIDAKERLADLEGDFGPTDEVGLAPEPEGQEEKKAISSIETTDVSSADT